MKPDQYKCPYCQLSYPSADELNKHMLTCPILFSAHQYKPGMGLDALKRAKDVTDKLKVHGKAQECTCSMQDLATGFGHKDGCPLDRSKEFAHEHEPHSQSDKYAGRRIGGRIPNPFPKEPSDKLEDGGSGNVVQGWLIDLKELMDVIEGEMDGKRLSSNALQSIKKFSSNRELQAARDLVQSFDDWMSNQVDKDDMDEYDKGLIRAGRKLHYLENELLKKENNDS